jgi:Ankyrin repeats (many copies)
VRFGADVNLTDAEGCTPLHKVCQRERVRVRDERVRGERVRGERVRGERVRGERVRESERGE